MNEQDNFFIFCDNLVKIYKVAELEVVALQGLDLRVRRGEIVGIVGNSGSGKSTLLNTLGGLDRPSAGRCFVDGRDLVKMTDGQLVNYRRHTVGMVWQQVSQNLIPYLTARENVELPMLAAGNGGRRGRQRAVELLETVGLSQRVDHKLLQLSGGEQQRVAISVALANNPPLLLADEPTGELDSGNAQMIYNAFREITRRFGTTILIVTHDRNIRWHVDRVVQIRDGRTSTETLRRVDAEEKEVHEEYIVLDTVGRLQIPKEYIEQFEMKDRVKLEVVDGGIIIRTEDFQKDEGDNNAQ